MKAAGFSDPRIIKQNKLKDEVEGFPVGVYSTEIRAFKITQQEQSPVTQHLLPVDNQCEDYGQTAMYNGLLPDSSARFVLDDHHVFERNKPEKVCRNTARMLKDTRLCKYFQVSKPIEHFGLFPCGDEPSEKKTTNNDDKLGACC